MVQPPDVPADAPRVGRFLKSARLGAGGGGEVWKAWDPELSRWVALKLLHGADPEELARFRREAQIAGRLRHPNIAAIFEVGEADQRPFIAMEYIEGTTLKGLRERDARLLARLMRDAARAVHAAHESGVVHRDLKGENMMVARDAGGLHLYVMDFGLAKHVSGAGLSRSGTAIGTPAFMAPEQARGELDRVDRRSDVWGLGATLFDLLAGRTPFVGEVFDVLLQVATEEPPRLRALSPSVDADLETIVMKCIERDPARRYQTAQALADDLERYLNNEPVEARPASFTYRLGKRLARRKGVLATAAAGIAAIAVVGLIAGLLLRGQGDALVDEMKTRAAEALDAALDLRRSGDTDGMARYVDRAEQACRAVIAQRPSLAEPHYLLGRMRRAQMKDAEALQEQDEAIRLDPAHAGARYERIVLTSALLWSRARKLRDAAERREGDRAILAGGGARSVPMRSMLARMDPESQSLIGRMREDLAAATNLDPERSTCARGLLAQAEGTDEEAAVLLRSALALDEAALALAHQEIDAERLDPAFAVLDEAIARDKGNAVLRRTRGTALVAQGRLARLQGGDPIAILKRGIQDLEGALKVLPERKEWRLERARALSLLGNALSLQGADTDAVYGEGVRECDAVLAAHPENAAAFASRGAVRLNWGYARYRWGAAHLDLFRQAREDLDRAIELAPEDGEHFLLRARARLNLRGDADAAESDAGEAIRRIPSDPRAWTMRGQCRIERAAEAAAARRPWRDLMQGALADFDEALRIDSNHIEALHRRGSATMHLARRDAAEGRPWESSFELAERDLVAALALNPRHVEILEIRANLYAARGQLEWRRRRDGPTWFRKAEADLKAAIAIDPKSAEAMFELGQLMTAWADCLQIVEHSPSAEYIERLERAREETAKAVTLRPDPRWRKCLVHATFSLAGALEEIRTPRAALWSETFTVIDELIRDNPNDAELYRLRGMGRTNQALTGVLYRGTDPRPGYQESLLDYKQALRRDPTDLESYTGLAHTHKLWGDYLAWRKEDPNEWYFRAIEDWKAALKVAPEAPRPLKGLAVQAYTLASHLPDAKRAAELLRTSIECGEKLAALDAGDDDAYTTLGAAKVNLSTRLQGEESVVLLREAIGHFTKAIELNGRNSTALHYRGNAHINLGGRYESRPNVATPWFRKAVADYEAAIRLGDRSPQIARALEHARKWLKENPQD